jgi:hypothetical protein
MATANCTRWVRTLNEKEPRQSGGRPPRLLRFSENEKDGNPDRDIEQSYGTILAAWKGIGQSQRPTLPTNALSTGANRDASRATISCSPKAGVFYQRTCAPRKYTLKNSSDACGTEGGPWKGLPRNSLAMVLRAADRVNRLVIDQRARCHSISSDIFQCRISNAIECGENHGYGREDGRAVHRRGILGDAEDFAFPRIH